MEYVKAELLHFDIQNPRLVEQQIGKADEDEVLNILWKESAIRDIVMSIMANGYFETEPMLVIRDKDQYIVVEGNRRLAAVKAIINPNSIDNGGMSKFEPRITEELRQSLKNHIPVTILEDRKDAWQYIGFKHVKGAAKWDSLAKAEYIATVHNDYGVDLENIAQQIGDSNNIVKKLYQGLMIVKQANAQTDFKLDDLYYKRLYFSHIYTAIGYTGFQQYLGFDPNNVSASPISKDKLQNLEDICLWLFGSNSKDIRPVIQSQNPDLRHLDAVLLSSEATQLLKSSGSLDDAFDMSQDGVDILYDSLVEAQSKLEKAASKTHYYDGTNRDIVLTAMNVANAADTLFDTLKNIYNKARGIDADKRTIE